MLDPQWETSIVVEFMTGERDFIGEMVDLDDYSNSDIDE